LALSPIGKAIAYTHNHWEGLQTFLSDGRLEIDNNATERDISPSSSPERISCLPVHQQALILSVSISHSF
jgi:hypothetical protein